RLYNYYDDGQRNTVGALECARYVFLSDPRTGQGLAMVDEHWSYGIRSAAASMLACKWLAPEAPRVLGLVRLGAMATNALRRLPTLLRLQETRCASRRRETREAFAKRWSAALGVPVRPYDTVEEVVRGADLAVGGTTSSDIMTREQWLKPGSLFISLARRELDPDGWKRMDKIVLDSWDMNMRMPVFGSMAEKGQTSREQIYAEIQEVVAGTTPGRTHKDERILIHTTGLVAHDIALAHHVFMRANEEGRGIRLPAARPRE